jgi:hypothetical protein
MRKTTVLVVSPPALGQLVRYLFDGRPEFEVVGTFENLSNLTRHSRRLLPEIIVANVKPVTTGVCPAILSIKKSSPLSKVIVICSIRDIIRGARRCGADACLEQEKLVFHLLPTARVLSRSRHRT